MVNGQQYHKNASLTNFLLPEDYKAENLATKSVFFALNLLL
jgi:hypothetical protein